MSCYLFNINLFERKNNEPLELEFYAGDITSVYSDAILISAYKSSFVPTKGTIFKRLKEKYNIEYDREYPVGFKEIVKGFSEFPTKGTDAFKRIFVIEMLDLSVSSENENAIIDNGFYTIEKALAHDALKGLKTISLPLIGTGAQALDVGEIARKTIQIVKNIAQVNGTLEKVRVFSYNLKNTAILNRTIDQYFNKGNLPGEKSSELLLKASVAELKSKKDPNSEALKESLNELYEIASSPSTSIKSIALSGRLIAEKCAESLCLIWKLSPKNTTLNEKLYVCHPKIKEAEKMWIFSYFKLLQSCGNYAVHPNKYRLNSDDASAIIISALRVSEFVNEIESTAN